MCHEPQRDRKLANEPVGRMRREGMGAVGRGGHSGTRWVRGYRGEGEEANRAGVGGFGGRLEASGEAATTEHP